MTKWKRLYPATWGESERQRAERLATFVEAAALEFREVREEQRQAGKDIYPIHLTVGQDGFELLRRAFSYDPGKYSGSGILNVNGIKVRFRVTDGRDPVPVDACALSYSGKQVATWVAPATLSVAEQEVYERLRNDEVARERAVEMARWLTEA